MSVAPSRAAHRLVPEVALAGEATLRNLGDTPLTGITAQVDGAPANVIVEVQVPGALEASGSAAMAYTLTATDASVPQADITIALTSSAGATATLSLAVRVAPLVPQLAVEPARLETGMVRGGQTFVEFDVTNTGGAATGELDVLLPAFSWLAVASATPIGPLAPGASSTVVLSLLPPDDLPLVPFEGALVVAGPTANVSVPFRFVALSDGVGSMKVEVTDEFTYWADGNPPVVGATVTVRNPFDGTVVASGVTDATSAVVFDNLPEAPYIVEARAPEHTTFRGAADVVAGEQTFVDAFLSRQLVTYNWTVRPTEIEDEYTFTVEAVFQTNVPAPVITVEPRLIDLNELPPDAQIDLRITNNGLIDADDVSIDAGGNSRYSIEPLAGGIGTLGPGETVSVPVRIRDNGGPDPCDDLRLGVRYSLVCRERRFYWVPIGVVYHRGFCGGTPPSSGCDRCGPGGGTIPQPFGQPVTFDRPISCDPCEDRRNDAIVNCVIRFLPLGCPINLALGGHNCYTTCSDEPESRACAFACANAVITGVISCAVPGLFFAWVPLICMHDIVTACDPDDAEGVAAAGVAGAHGDVDSAVDFLAVQTDRLTAILEAYTELFGDPIWLSGTPDEALVAAEWVEAFQAAIDPASDDGQLVSAGERNALLARPRASQLADAHLHTFLDRWNRSIAYWDAGIFDLADVPPGESTDFIALDVMQAKFSAANAAAEANIAEGFDELFAGVETARDALDEALATEAAGICARVRVRIEQDAVLTRTAFRATLELDNDSDAPLEAISVSLTIRDLLRQDAVDRFAVGAPDLTELSAVDGTGVLAPGTSGRADWLILPTTDAAPTEPVRYLVGGSLTYTHNGIEVTVPLFPDPIEVLPDPRLDLKYFWQRDVFSDDPFTPEVEPAEPFSLGVMVTNNGGGAARDFRITSGRPEIVENEKGLLIAFEIIGTQVGGEPTAPSLTVHFGEIAPGATTVARWLLTSTLQGTFMGYEASFAHVDGLGEARTSLVDSLSIHELIHVVRIDEPADDGMPDFLVNDTIDPDDLPDVIHSSDGTLLPVRVQLAGTIDSPAAADDLVVELTADLLAGWIYLRVDDPAAGGYRLTRVMRADGREIRLDDNAWITRRVIRLRDEPPREENRLHIVDRLDTEGPVTYTLVYEDDRPLPGDFDGDGDVDLADYVVLATCFGGSDVRPTGPVCCPTGSEPPEPCNSPGDFDGDNDIDLADVIEFQFRFTGPQ